MKSTVKQRTRDRLTPAKGASSPWLRASVLVLAVHASARAIALMFDLASAEDRPQSQWAGGVIVAVMMVTIVMCVHGAVIYALVHGVRGGRAGASALAIVTLIGAVSAGSIPAAIVALALGVATLWAVWLESGAARRGRTLGDE